MHQARCFIIALASWDLDNPRSSSLKNYTDNFSILIGTDVEAQVSRSIASTFKKSVR